MQYRSGKHGEKISVLGYGCMRFAKKGASIDMVQTEQQILRAIELGVNYFDTAYIYPGSEEALGTILSKNNKREEVMIATKLPQYLISSSKAIDRYFEEECKRLKTDYIDFYLMHMLTDYQAWEKLKRLGILEWIQKQKETGRIRNIGFSYHGGYEQFSKILNDYDWDFCQIQYNYMDEVSQAGKAGLLEAYEKNIPVVIMEPLRGGKLVNLLPKQAKEVISQFEKGWSPAELAFRWLYNQKEVTCVLSGMNDMAMVEENCRVASESTIGHLEERDLALYEEIKQSILSTVKIGCTECGYCLPCPVGVAIPDTFRAYNRMFTEGKGQGRNDYMMTVALQKDPGVVSKCIQCHKCEGHCPQHLEIPTLLQEADKALLPPYYKAGVAIARKFLNRR